MVAKVGSKQQYTIAYIARGTWKYLTRRWVIILLVKVILSQCGHVSMQLTVMIMVIDHYCRKDYHEQRVITDGLFQTGGDTFSPSVCE